MARSQTYQEKGGAPTAERARPSRNGRTPGLDAIMVSYLELPTDKLTEDHEAKFQDARDVLWQAVNVHVDKIDELEEAGITKGFQVRRAQKDFDKVLQSASRLDFHPVGLWGISSEFLKVALDPNKQIPDYARDAIADVAVAVGGDKLPAEKVRYIAERHLGLLKLSQNTPLNDPQVESMRVAEKMLDTYGLSIDITEIPSVKDDIAELANKLAETAKEHSRKATFAGAAALVAVAVVAPTAAAATETSSSSTQSVSVSNQSPASVDTVSSFGTATQAAALHEVQTSVTVSTEKTAVSAVGTMTSPAETALSEVSVSVGIGANHDQAPISVSSLTETAISGITIPTQVGLDLNAEPAKIQAISTRLSTPQTMISNLRIGLPETSVEITEVSSRTRAEKPRLDPTKATAEELSIEAIYEYIENDGNMYGASSLILESFGENFKKKKNGKYEPANPILVENAKGLQNTFDALIKKGGHKDANYINSTLMALSVFEALGNDPTIFNSEDVQAMVANIKRPDDAYMGKLFDQYAAKANEALAANGGEMLKGISEPLKAQVGTVYTHLILASIPAEQQAAEIQAIKDAEAEAARIAAEQAARGANYGSTVEGQAIQNLIDRSPGNMESLDWQSTQWRAFTAYQWWMTNSDYTLPQIAGIVSNLIGESSIAPARNQTEGGNAQGTAQWEGDRIIALKNEAARRGIPWTDFNFQMEWIKHELEGRGGASLRQATDHFSAAKAFLREFETPYVAVIGYETGDWSKADAETWDRVHQGQPILDAFLGEAGAVNAARAAEEAARAAAEEAARAGEACPPGTHDMGKVSNGKKELHMCAIPGTVETDSGRPVEVIAEIAANMLAMVNQMRVDTGLSVIPATDSYRTYEQQEYLRMCYDTKSCNGGNKAAMPGESNHNWGEAVDWSWEVWSWLWGGEDCILSTADNCQQNPKKFGFWSNPEATDGEKWHFSTTGG